LPVGCDPERPVVVGEISCEVVLANDGSGLLELVPQPFRRLQARGIGVRRAARPDPGMVGDQPSLQPNPNPVEVGAPINETVGRCLVDGWVSQTVTTW